MRFPKTLIAALFAFAAGGALAKPDGVLFLGADASATTDQVALLFFNQPIRHPDDVPMLVTAIGPDAEFRGKSARNHGVAVLAPGAYRVTLVCKLSLRDVIIQETHEFAAGMTYTLRCKGRTPRQVKLAIAETESAP